MTRQLEENDDSPSACTETLHRGKWRQVGKRLGSAMILGRTPVDQIMGIAMCVRHEHCPGLARDPQLDGRD